VKKKESITYSECLSVALAIQNAKRMRLVIFSYVAYLTVQYFFPRFLSKNTISKKTAIEETICLICSAKFV